jgi:hypothetical protein
MGRAARRPTDLAGEIEMNCDPDAAASDETRDVLEPATVVEDMASAVGRVRRLAMDVFKGDAALFADGTQESPNDRSGS